MLAPRLLAGPVELFTYAEPRSVPVPLPRAAVLMAGVAYTNTRWYQRRNGQVTTVRRGQFAQQLSAYFADCPAQTVAREDEHHRFRDLPPLVDEYNRYVATMRK